MADNAECSLPPRRVRTKKKRARDGKLYSIFLGYGEEAGKLLERTEKLKTLRNYHSLAQLMNWMLSEIERTWPRPSIEIIIPDPAEDQSAMKMQYVDDKSPLHMLGSCVENILGRDIGKDEHT